MRQIIVDVNIDNLLRFYGTVVISTTMKQPSLSVECCLTFGPRNFPKHDMNAKPSQNGQTKLRFGSPRLVVVVAAAAVVVVVGIVVVAAAVVFVMIITKIIKIQQ
ncbi:hypothetical protein ElyMa_003148100 [Elysia marginata]|uniref:Uncharacterized protein n=1 Tax=Elysia marginata TaxID=1093978 RepID=A0AAV4IYM9_9GAST|nr:hypothetical protein ElyMa_003148100 [Elysia marginata]